MTVEGDPTRPATAAASAAPPDLSTLAIGLLKGVIYRWDTLARARWLVNCRMHYWGNIDTHGFAILDQLRGRFGHLASFLMDREALDAHEVHWGEEPDQSTHELPRLTPDERTLFDDLRDNRIRRNLRLERERVGFHWVGEGLCRILGNCDHG